MPQVKDEGDGKRHSKKSGSFSIYGDIFIVHVEGKDPKGETTTGSKVIDVSSIDKDEIVVRSHALDDKNGDFSFKLSANSTI